MKACFDAIVAGAGVAGSAMAGLLGRQGLKVLLLDKASFPREKPCGEGLLPHGVAVLERMGLHEKLGSGTRLKGLKYRVAGICAEAKFPSNGLGVRRLSFDAALSRWAASCPNVRFEESTLIESPLIEDGRVLGVVARSAGGAKEQWRAPLTVCADGLHSTLRAKLGLRVRWPDLRRFALVSHLDRVAGLEGHVEVFLEDGFELYLTPTQDGVCAALLSRRWPLPDKDFLGRIRRLESLSSRLEGSCQIGPARAWGPLGPWVRRAYGEGFMLLGDSAGSPDPISGEGMALALSLAYNARIVAAKAAEHGGCAKVLQDYETLRLKAYRSAFGLSRSLTALTRSPWLRKRVVGNLLRKRGLFGKLVDLACGQSSAHFGLIDSLRLVF